MRDYNAVFLHMCVDCFYVSHNITMTVLVFVTISCTLIGLQGVTLKKFIKYCSSKETQCNVFDL